MIKYIFSINAGRCGSKYLAKLFQHCTDCKSFHEPRPRLNGKPMFEYLKGNTQLMETMIEWKFSSINRERKAGQIYIETNHCFIKGFGWLLASRIPNEEIGIIIIKRPKNEIINSLYNKGTSPISPIGRKWIMTPLMKDAVHKTTLMEKFRYNLFSYFYRIINNKTNKNLPRFIKKYEFRLLEWYVKETYAQGEKFKKEHPNVKIFETTLEKLNNIKEIENIINFFGLNISLKPSIHNFIGIPINKTNRKN